MTWRVKRTGQRYRLIIFPLRWLPLTVLGVLSLFMSGFLVTNTIAALLAQHVRQIEAYKVAMDQANANIKKQNEDIKLQNEEMKKLGEERNEMVAKYNKVVQEFNDLAKKWNDLQAAATNAPAKK